MITQMESGLLAEKRVTTEMIKQLRERTGAGVMECKRALEDAQGDTSEAERLLSVWGSARAEKKMGREASQGLVEAYVHAGGRIGVLVEVNCETDFVARTEEFKTLVHNLAMHIAWNNPKEIEASPDGSIAIEEDLPLLDQPFVRDSEITVRELLKSAIAKLGENIVIRRFARFELGGA